MCPSLDYVYRMTWNEYIIRLSAYRRKEEKKDFRLRELAWASFSAPYQDPNKMPKSKQQFMPLSTDKKRTSELKDVMIKAIENAKKEYIEQLEKKSG